MTYDKSKQAGYISPPHDRAWHIEELAIAVAFNLNSNTPSRVYSLNLRLDLWSTNHTSRGVQHLSLSTEGLSQTPEQPVQTMDYRDAVVPNLHTLRTNPGISEMVINLLASYERRVYSDLL